VLPIPASDNLLKPTVNVHRPCCVWKEENIVGPIKVEKVQQITEKNTKTSSYFHSKPRI
jgi:hypothetical protein